MITLFLMSKKGLLVLESLINNGYTDIIDKVVCARDTSIPNDYYEEIKNTCQENKILFYDKSERYRVSSKFAFAISWRWILKLNKAKLIIFHDSLLPKYRGFNPLVSCLLNREKEIGVTALFASKEFDTGPIIMQSSSRISYPIKLSKAIDVISKNYIVLCLEMASKIKCNIEIDSEPQDENKATYSIWRDEEDYRIDWNQSADDICLHVDSLGYPYLGASCYIDGKKIRVFEVEKYENLNIENRMPGKLILKKRGLPVVVCGEGLIKIKSAVYADSKEPVFPTKKYRLRFT